MIQVKEFIDTDNSFASNKANEFLATLKEEQVISVQYGVITKSTPTRTEHQRSCILVVYRTE